MKELGEKFKELRDRIDSIEDIEEAPTLNRRRVEIQEYDNEMFVVLGEAAVEEVQRCS